MRWIKAFLVFGCCALSSTAQSSTTVSSRHINAVIVVGTSFFVYFDGADNGSSCTYKSRYVFDGSTAAGQTMVAVALTAYSLNKTVNLVGSGTGGAPCSGDSEGLALIHSL